MGTLDKEDFDHATLRENANNGNGGKRGISTVGTSKDVCAMRIPEDWGNIDEIIKALKKDCRNVSTSKGMTWSQLKRNGALNGSLDGMDFSNVSFVHANISKSDFSKAKGLTGKQLMESSVFWSGSYEHRMLHSYLSEDIYDELNCVRLPDNLDFTGASFVGKDVSWVDFSKAKGLTWGQLAEAKQRWKIVIPDGMDFTGVSFKGKDILGINFRKSTGLTGRQLAEANCIREIQFPDGMDFTGVSFAGKELSGIDFSKAKGLTAVQLLEATELCKTIIPDGMDFTGVSFSGKNISDIDFSKTKGLTAAQLFEAAELWGAVIPDGLDFTGVSFKGKKLHGIDFSKAIGLSGAQLAEADQLFGLTFPNGIDFAGVSFKNKNIGCSDFSNTTGLTWQQLAEAEEFYSITIPQGMDFTGVSFCEKNIHGTNFSKACGLTSGQLLEAESIFGIKLPTGVDFTGVSFLGKNISMIDFSKACGLTGGQLLEAKDIYGIKLPEGMDFTGVSFRGKDIRGIDFSKACGLTGGQLLEAKDISRIKLPDGMDFTGISFCGKDISMIDFSQAIGLTKEQVEEALNYEWVRLPLTIECGMYADSKKNAKSTDAHKRSIPVKCFDEMYTLRECRMINDIRFTYDCGYIPICMRAPRHVRYVSYGGGGKVLTLRFYYATQVWNEAVRILNRENRDFARGLFGRPHWVVVDKAYEMLEFEEGFYGEMSKLFWEKLREIADARKLKVSEGVYSWVKNLRDFYGDVGRKFGTEIEKWYVVDIPSLSNFDDASLDNTDDRVLKKSYSWEDIKDFFLEITPKQLSLLYYIDMNFKYAKRNAEAVLFEACENLEFEKVKMAVERGANLNAFDHEGKTAISACIDGAEIDFEDDIDRSIYDPNIEAAKPRIDKAKEIIEYLLGQGADIDLFGGKGVPPLLRCADSGNVELLEFLLKKGANPNHNPNTFIVDDDGDICSAVLDKVYLSIDAQAGSVYLQMRDLLLKYGAK